MSMCVCIIIIIMFIQLQSLYSHHNNYYDDIVKIS
jgi:hypothetical protein